VVTFRPSGEFHSPRTGQVAEPTTAAPLVRILFVRVFLDAMDRLF